MASNSTQIITDLTTVITNISATQTTRANAAAGPITDVNGTVNLLKTKAQEMVEILAYLLEGVQFVTSQSAPANGIFQTGDSNAANGYNLLTGIYQILK